MSNFNTVTPTNESQEGDLYLLGRGNTSRTQKREIVAAGLANARWSSEAVYLTGSNIVGSDGVNYQAVTDSGTGTAAGAVDPVTDTLESHWKVVKIYKETGGLVNGEIETKDFVKTPEIMVDKILHTDGSETTLVEIPSLENRMIAAACTFKGTGLVSIKTELNVLQVQDQGTGTYRVIFKNPIKGNVNIQVTSSSEQTQVAPIDDFNLNYVDILTTNPTGSRSDAKLVCVTVYSL